MTRTIDSKNPSSVTKKKEIWAWCFYDFANSSFTTIIVTVSYSIYFTQIVAKGHHPEVWWGWGYGISMLLVGIISPVLGALADYSGNKKNFLILFSSLCIVATTLLVFVKAGDIWMGISLFILANIGFNGALTFYNAFLNDIARPENMGRISGFGYSLGYVGGLLSLLMVFPLIQGGFNEENLFLYRLSFPATAAFFLIFAIPSILYLQQKPDLSIKKPNPTLWKIGFRRVFGTLGEIQRHKELFKFLLAYLVYIDGINTVIVFAGIFSVTVLGFSPKELVIFFMIMQISAGIGAYVFGFFTDWWGPKKIIYLTLCLWIGLMVWAFFVPSKFQFYLLGLLAGVALGSNQSSSRTLLGLLAPRNKISEFYGFFSLTGKMAATIGPPVFGMITAATGSQRWAILSLIVFFLVGFLLLLRVNQETGIQEATKPA